MKKTTEKEPEALTPQEVADILRITKNTVYELVKRGELNGYRVGNKLRVDRSDVDLYKNSSKKLKPDTTAAGILQNGSSQLEASRYYTINNNFIICGQDSILELLTRYLEQYQTPYNRVMRTYAGSYNGLFSLYNDTVQLATAHLWDGNTNEYNVPYVKRMLPGISAVIIRLAKRMEGFYVPKGNPKQIFTWEDLSRSDVVIVNREKGSGARVLLDEHLRLLNIDTTSVQGYERECLTHLAVAGTVARGGADVAVGCENSLRQVPSLEFIPLQQECYDLVFKKENEHEPLFEAAIKFIKSKAFKEELDALGGYETSETGKTIAET